MMSRGTGNFGTYVKRDGEFWHKQALEEKQNSLLNLLIDGTIDKEIYNAKKLS